MFYIRVLFLFVLLRNECQLCTRSRKIIWPGKCL